MKLCLTLFLHVEDSVMYNLKFTKFANELDVSQHLALGHEPGFKLVLRRLVSIVKRGVGLGPVLKFFFALIDQKSGH